MSRLGDRIKSAYSGLADKISDQKWFQELKSKWDELDSQSRFYLKSGLGIATLAGCILLLFGFYWSVRSKRSEYREKQELLALVQTANNELKLLRESSPGGSAASNGGWRPYLQSVATTAGVDPANIEVGEEKQGATSDVTEEALIDVSLKKINIRHVVRYLFSLENGPQPIKVRNLVIDTKSDPEGYLDASIALSAFEIKQ